MKRALKNVATGALALAIIAGSGMAALSPAALPMAQAAATPTGILPTPQEVNTTGVSVPLTGTVKVAVGATTDAAAKDLLGQVINKAGGTASFVDAGTAAGATVFLGTAANNSAIPAALAAVGATSADALATDGYVIATGTIAGKPALVLNGKDATGTFYAVQSLSQVVANGSAPAMTVKDWPLMSIRGAIEGFYGIPWSHQARLDQLDFYGKHKLNTYIYTPKDDNYLRAKWRDLYPAAELADLKELVDEANANHVNFTFALSPGNDVCYSSDADYNSTVAKFDQLRSIGVSSFYIALDDIDPSLKCAADLAKFTSSGFRKLADGQAFYLNRIVNDYVKVHNLQPLQTVPTNYNGSAEDPYKDQFGLATDDSILIQWTGEGVFSNTITEASVTKAVDTYNAEHFYIWDNLPVNDGQRGRLFLNPLEGRDPNLYKHIDGITSNPMIEAYASMIALAGFGDYSWNSPAYNAATTQSAIITELAGAEAAVRKSLETFVDLNQSWKPYRPNSKTAPALSADVAAFWTAYDAGNVAGMKSLQDRLATIKAGPETLATMAMKGFYDDSKPWIDAAAHWATAMEEQVAMLIAIKSGNGVVATDAALEANAEMALAKRATVPDVGPNNIGITPNQIIPSVGDGVFEIFTAAAQARYNTWLNLTPVAAANNFPGTASSSLATYQQNTPGKMVDGNASTLWWSSAPPVVGSTVTLDLGAVKPVGKVLIQQADSDSQAGDMIYNARLEYSADNSTWTSAGTFASKPRIEQSFDTPVSARYIRLVAAAANSGGQWVKIREFQAFEATQKLTTNLAGANGTGPASAFDATINSAFEAATAPVAGAHLTYVLDTPAAMKSVAVVGHMAGDLQVKSDDEWVTLGALNPAVSFQEAVLTQATISGVRILFKSGAGRAVGVGPVVYELGVRATGPVGSGPYVGDVVEPSPTATPTVTPSPTTTPSASSSATATPSGTPSATPSGTPSATPSGTPSATPSGTPSATPSGTPSATPSGTPSATPSGTPSATPSGTPSAGITLSAGTLAPGGRLTVSGTGFKPGSEASFTLHSTPVLLGTVTADAQGVVTLSVNLPVDVAPGLHSIVIDGVGVDGTSRQLSAPLTITGAATAAVTTPAAADGLASTGANATMLGGLAVLLLIAGAGVFAVTRRRVASH
ncbi:beta-N-acetylglucosaminidase domain-containing protein [Arthrobacter glacialis]|uniref:beta-N-acetylglucosaminidase domain-containing protein n=1 Tax=Arthrobacter glacialis TaxID=1664 RepID=UPI0010573FA8|nr:beta-N-acetylglucosaminidase domain-containing protein [Arthrobacter glacialis]